MTVANPNTWFFLSVLCITLWRALSSYFMGHSLYGDEAQYWVWSQEFALGYYSKPPLMAWVIRFFTSMFGDGPFVIRLFPLIAYPLSATAIYLLGKRMFSGVHAFWVAFIFLTIPGISFSSFLASTDPLLLLFWSFGLLFLWRACETNQVKWWVLTGVCIGLGFLAKYAMIAFIASMMLVIVCSPQRKAIFSTMGVWISLSVSVLFLLPNLYWNMENGFVSFVHTVDNANLAGHYFQLKYLPEFLMGQFGLLGPILFPVLVYLLVRKIKEIWHDPALRFLFLFTVPLFVFFTIKAILSGAHPNWTAPAYITGVILVVHWILEKDHKWMLKLTVLINLIAMAALHHHDPILNALHIERSKIIQSFKSSIYWDKVVKEVEHIADQNPSVQGVFSDDRMMTAELIYYLRHTNLKVGKWNTTGQVKDHFDMKYPLKSLGVENILVVSRWMRKEEFASYAEKVVQYPDITVVLGRNFQKTYKVFLLSGLR